MPNSKLIKFALSKASSKNTQEKGKSKWTEKTLFRYLFYVDLNNINRKVLHLSKTLSKNTQEKVKLAY